MAKYKLKYAVMGSGDVLIQSGEVLSEAEISARLSRYELGYSLEDWLQRGIAEVVEEEPPKEPQAKGKAKGDQ